MGSSDIKSSFEVNLNDPKKSLQVHNLKYFSDTKKNKSFLAHTFVM